MACGLLILLYVMRGCTSDWVSDWMSPVQNQFDEITSRRSVGGSLKAFEDEYQRMLPRIQEGTEVTPLRLQAERENREQSTASLKLKLENTLTNAKMLAETLKGQIIALSTKENSLKEAITNGRSGVTTVTVHTMSQLPRSYIVREGLWSLCTGVIQAPAAQGPSNFFTGLFSSPRCIGQEVPSRMDPCAFNSVIKYETIPRQRRRQYVEDDYLCLKRNFNTTLEQYMSVPRRLVNETCHNGIIRHLEDNNLECSIRTLSEYNFYPNRGVSLPTLPLEYCVETDGSCKLIVAWHISNTSIEHFEFLKDEQNFKKYFIKTL